jgi:hypothetical protein
MILSGKARLNVHNLVLKRVCARIFPSLAPTKPDDPSSAANRKAWEVLSTFTKPFQTAFSVSDPITHGDERFLQERIFGAQGQPRTTIKGAGHFRQEDKGEELARVIVDFIATTPAQVYESPQLYRSGWPAVRKTEIRLLPSFP